MGISKEDRRAFADATEGVKPLKPNDRVVPTRRPPKPKARQTRAAREDILEQSLRDASEAALAEEISFRRPGVPEKTFRRLRRGEFSIEAELDLHGLTETQARANLQGFLAECTSRGLGCVRVIHGKGARSGPDGPILKASVQRWLRLWDDVLAYVSANRKHGGSGAVYVLLRRINRIHRER